MMAKIKVQSRYDDCGSLDEVVARYRKLDRFYQHLVNGGRYHTMYELKPNNFREQGGVHINIGRNGELLFGGGGCHRLAIAQILKLPQIPAQIGVCHKQAVVNNLISSLRRETEPV